jgi:transcriptional regulator with XRE-family HTH domain
LVALIAKVAKNNTVEHMSHRVLGNYLRTHRKRSGLSQREVAFLLGYRNKTQVSRHERARTAPPLLVAIAYEVIFQSPVSALFTQARANAKRSVETKLATFEANLKRSGKDTDARATAQKLAWLTQRRAS